MFSRFECHHVMPPLIRHCRRFQSLTTYSAASSPPHSSYSTSVTDLPPLSLLPPNPTLSQIFQCHAQLIVLGHATSRASMSHLLSFCATSSSSTLPPSYLLSIFHRIHIPNVFATNNLIRCLPNNVAFEIYADMRRRGTPTNNFTFPFVLAACGKVPPLVWEGLQVHVHVVKMGQDGDVYVRNGLIHFYGVCGLVDDARKVFDEMPERRDVVSWNAMVAGYTREGRVVECEEVFDRMPERDGVSWSTMIAAYVQGGFLENGVRLFREMREMGVPVNEATLVTVLSSCAQLGLLENGEFVHEEIRKLRFPITTPVGTALVDMYAKCGSIEMSKQVFDLMPRRDVFAWNSMICGLALHGLGMETLEHFRKFTEEGYHPNNVTFVGVLNACSRTGLVNEGRFYFNSMVNEHGIEPEMEHYGCMVDLLGRAGLVSEAVKMVEQMKFQPDPVIWGTLLGACKIHGLVELGSKIGNKLIELEPNHDGHYVLLAGVYAKAKKWDDVSKIRRLMFSRGTNKVAGWSLIEAQGTTHKFIVGDREHPRSMEVHEMNESILIRLSEAGYVADVSSVLHDIGEEEKVEMVKVHSERLAIAFGFMVVEPGRPIRVVKNLRVCWDCHEASKLISKVFEREIIVRDGSRFHHFKDGNCSCNDYW